MYFGVSRPSIKSTNVRASLNMYFGVSWPSVKITSVKTLKISNRVDKKYVFRHIYKSGNSDISVNGWKHLLLRHEIGCPLVYLSSFLFLLFLLLSDYYTSSSYLTITLIALTVLLSCCSMYFLSLFFTDTIKRCMGISAPCCMLHLIAVVYRVAGCWKQTAEYNQKWFFLMWHTW